MKLSNDVNNKLIFVICWMETWKNACKISKILLNVVKNGEKFMKLLLVLLPKITNKINGILISILFLLKWKPLSKDALN